MATCREKGIDGVPDKENKVIKGISERRNAANALCFRLEQSIRRIDKTLEKKGLKDDFKTALESQKERQEKLLEEIKDLIKKPTDEEFENAKGDWKKLKEIALDAFPVFKQAVKKESSIEDPKGRFNQIIAFLIIQKKELEKGVSTGMAAAEVEEKKATIIDLCKQAAKAISEMNDQEQQSLALDLLTTQMSEAIDGGITELKDERLAIIKTVFDGACKNIVETEDLDQQFASMEVLIAQITKMIEFGVTELEAEVPRMQKTIIEGMCDRIVESNLKPKEKALLLADTGIRMYKYGFEGKSELIQIFFDRAYEIARKYVEEESPKEDDLAMLPQDIGKGPSAHTLLTEIENKALEAGLNPEIKNLKEKGDRVSEDTYGSVETAIEMIEHEDIRSAIDVLEKAAENAKDNPQALAHISCEVLRHFSHKENRHLIEIRDWALSVLDNACSGASGDMDSLRFITRRIRDVLVEVDPRKGADNFKDGLVMRLKNMFVEASDVAVANSDIDQIIDIAREIADETALPKAERNKLAFEICKKAEKCAGNDPKKLEQVAMMVFDKFKTPEGEEFVIDTFKTIGEVSNNSRELVVTTIKMLEFFGGSHSEHLKKTALEMFGRAEEHIQEPGRTRSYIRLYFTMNDFGLLGYDEAVSKFETVLESDIEDNISVALETPKAIKELLDMGARPDLAEKMLDCAEVRVGIEPERLIEFADKLSERGLDDQLLKLHNHIVRRLKYGHGDVSPMLDFCVALHKSEVKPFGENMSVDMCQMAKRKAGTNTEQLMKVAETAGKIDHEILAIECFGLAVDNVNDRDGLKEIIVEALELSESSDKEVLLTETMEKMFYLSGDDLEKIDDTARFVHESAKKNPQLESATLRGLQAKLLDGDTSHFMMAEYNTEIADLMIDLGFEAEGNEVLKSVESKEVPIEDEIDGEVTEESVEIPEEELERQASEKRVANSRIRNDKKKKAKMKKESGGFFGWLGRLFGRGNT